MLEWNHVAWIFQVIRIQFPLFSNSCWNPSKRRFFNEVQGRYRDCYEYPLNSKCLWKFKRRELVLIENGVDFRIGNPEELTKLGLPELDWKRRKQDLSKRWKRWRLLENSREAACPILKSQRETLRQHHAFGSFLAYWLDLRRRTKQAASNFSTAIRRGCRSNLWIVVSSVMM